jgi:TRAP transporter TAXI family solute receptor
MGRPLLAIRQACGGLIAVTAVGAIVLPFISGAVASERFISIGGGPTSGIYYRVAQAICGFANPAFAVTKVRCSPESTPGSLYNVQALGKGELDLALVQSDMLDAGSGGTAQGRSQTAAVPRTVMKLYAELLTLIVVEDSPIRTMDALKGKRIFAGGQGSGSRATWDALEQSMGWGSSATTKVAAAMDSISNPLCAGHMDALISLSGHPAAGISDQLAACSARFVPLDDRSISAFLATQPNAHKAAIPASAYKLPTDTATIGVTAVLVTRADVPEDVVHAVVSAVLRNLPAFKAVHPSLADVTLDTMQEGLRAPMHPGAVRAYKDAVTQR